jgi:hypothetical protein
MAHIVTMLATLSARPCNTEQRRKLALGAHPPWRWPPPIMEDEVLWRCFLALGPADLQGSTLSWVCCSIMPLHSSAAL